MEKLNQKKVTSLIHFNNLILKELRFNGINCWIAGGVLRDYFGDKKSTSDCDIFFKNINDFNKAVKYFKSNGAKIIWESNNGMKVQYKGNVYDLIKIFFKNPNDTIDSFDFTISMFATDGNKIYHGINSFNDLKEKKLVLNKISKPFSTLKRVLKHYNKGFNMSAEETKKLYKYLNNMEYNDETNNLLNMNGSSGENLINTAINKEPDGFFNRDKNNKNWIYIPLGLMIIYATYKTLKK
jgi:hypothetical protein